ncbi:MAG: inositol monophosphatase family protein [Verrucomicrobiales bacterium]
MLALRRGRTRYAGKSLNPLHCKLPEQGLGTMQKVMMTQELQVAIEAAQKAGTYLREHFGQKLHVDEASQYDIKLELDRTTQDLITDLILASFPDHAIFGEEGISGDQNSPWQWIIDPIDGTVNYFHSIPHFCISIAARHQSVLKVGVIYDPMRDELWTVDAGQPALLNGKPIAVTPTTQLSECVIATGFAKTKTSIVKGLPVLEHMVQKVRKCRLMGSAALDMAYVASGRLDAFIESGISLWDVAAGIVLTEAAGGTVKMTEREDQPGKFSIIAFNGKIPIEAEIEAATAG